MNKLKNRIHQARPKLKVVSPLVNKIVWGYFWVNLSIAIGFIFFYSPSTDIVIVKGPFTFAFWGVLFGLLSVIKGYGLLRNNWEIIKFGLLSGLAVKACWMFALMYRVWESPNTFVIASVWAFFSYIQAMTYVYFIPKITSTKEK